jgi:hypothetical protein
LQSELERAEARQQPAPAPDPVEHAPTHANPANPA